MSAKPEAKLHLPSGLSTDEEARWWEDHWDELEWTEAHAESVPPRPVRRSAPVGHLRLPIDLLDALKKKADEQGVSYHRLIRTWLEERMAAESSGSEALSHEGRA
ncbi:MAG: CopG family antitoxin [Actinomycetes bacterium]